MPRWTRLALALALLAVAVGVYLIVRPTSSLGILALVVGAGFLVQAALVLFEEDSATSEQSPWWRRSRLVEVALWGAAGVFILSFLGLAVRLFAVIIAAALMLSGVRKLAEALRKETTLDGRIASLAFGIASIGFGLLALLWPDITLLIASVVFGARLILGGVAAGWRAIRGTTDTSEQPKKPRWLARFSRTIIAVGTVVLVVIAGSISISIRDGFAVTDEFYAAPRVVPENPGELIRFEPFTRGVPTDAVGWRILYTTLRGDGTPAVASGIVVVPREGNGGWPIIDWNHGTTGFARSCAPSLLEKPFESGALFVLDRIVDEGWALVATDYIGLGTEGPHPYLLGLDSAHASLDAVRAAAAIDEARLGDDVVVWGHSQGGDAALWAGALADTYAPALAISGVAALAPASNRVGLIDNLPNVPGGSVFASFVVASYTVIYPDVTFREYIRPGAEPVTRAMAQRCLSGSGVLVSVLEALALSGDPEIFAKNPTTGVLATRIAENVPPATISAPLLIAQGEADALVIPSAQAEFVDQLRAAGQQVDYRTYPGLNHVPLVEAESPLIGELIDWTRDRFAGVPVP